MKRVVGFVSDEGVEVLADAVVDDLDFKVIQYGEPAETACVVCSVPEADGSEREALVSEPEVEVAPERVAEIWAATTYDPVPTPGQ